jgi:hypothetical protein
MDLLKSSNKNDTLDPLSVIIKLFIYVHKPVGTKLSIGSNKILLQDPGIFQSTVRKLYGDAKNDINIIFFPIIWACKHYLGNAELRPKFTNLFEIVVGSFDKLKETYQGNEIIYNIDQLKNIIISFIENHNFDPNTILPSYDSPGGKIKQGIYKHLNSIWTIKRIDIIFGYVDEILNSSSNELTNNLINSLNSYMNCIDMIIYNLITNL